MRSAVSAKIAGSGLRMPTSEESTMAAKLSIGSTPLVHQDRASLALLVSSRPSRPPDQILYQRDHFGAHLLTGRQAIGEATYVDRTPSRSSTSRHANLR